MLSTLSEEMSKSTEGKTNAVRLSDGGGGNLGIVGNCTGTGK